MITALVDWRLNGEPPSRNGTKAQAVSYLASFLPLAFGNWAELTSHLLVDSRRRSAAMGAAGSTGKMENGATASLVSFEVNDRLRRWQNHELYFSL